MAATGWLRFCVFGLFFLAGCIPLPPQPDVSTPYGLLEFPRTMQILTLNGHAIDDRLLLRDLRVAPGRHTLHFAYTALGTEGSRQHDGQRAAPFLLDTQAGRTYIFEAKT